MKTILKDGVWQGTWWPIVVEDLGKVTMVPVRQMPLGPVFHATI